MHEPVTNEEKLYHVQKDLDHNSPSPTMKSGVMEMYHNYTDTYMDDPDKNFQYCSWLIPGHKYNNIQTRTTQNNIDQFTED